MDDFSPLILRDIKDAPEPFQIAAAHAGIDFRKRLSRTGGIEYFMNHCACGAPFGDHFLHNEPSHVFFPTDENEAARILIWEIDWDVDMEGDCGFAGWSSLSPFEYGSHQEDLIKIPL